jgi:tetratricopeptide (TPR) repeat protein
MKIASAVVVSMLMCFCAYTQDYPLMDSLKRNLEQSKTAEQKIIWLGELSSLYMNINTPLANEYGNRQMEIAEFSRDRGLMLRAMLSNADRLYNSGGTQENFTKGKAFSERAYELAKFSNRDDYMAWAYIYLARGSRNEGNYDKALNYSNLAVSHSVAQSDSLKIAALNSLGDTYLVRKEKLLAFRNYLQALNLAEETGHYELLKEAYYTMSDFYSDLGDFERAKDYLFKLQSLTVKFRQPYERLNLYRKIGVVYTENKQYDLATGFYEKSMMLSDTLKLSIYKINGYFHIINQYLTSNQGSKALEYFKDKNELKEFMFHGGFDHFLYQTYAIAYTGMSQFDSAEYYYRKAEPGFLTKTNKYNQYGFYSNYANHYSKKGNYRKSLEYWLKAKAIGDERKDLGMLEELSMKLDSVYQKLGDYKNARYFNSQYHVYKDSLQKLSMEKDLLALEVENENRRKDREEAEAAKAKNERHNIQYMGITAGIAGVFIMLVMMGTFSVSKTTIRIIGFFAFIFLFEFIILLADNEIHHWTHGEPWKILAIKIALISVLLPLHHFLEEKVIHYLTSRKLMELKTKGLFQKISGKGETVVE